MDEEEEDAGGAEEEEEGEEDDKNKKKQFGHCKHFDPVALKVHKLRKDFFTFKAHT